MWSRKPKAGRTKRRCYGQANRAAAWLSCVVAVYSAKLLPSRIAVVQQRQALKDVPRRSAFRILWGCEREIILHRRNHSANEKEATLFDNFSVTSFVHLDFERAKAERRTTVQIQHGTLSLLLSNGRMAMRNLQKMASRLIPGWLFHVGGSAVSLLAKDENIRGVITKSIRQGYPGSAATYQDGVQSRHHLQRYVCTLWKEFIKVLC